MTSRRRTSRPVRTLMGRRQREADKQDKARRIGGIETGKATAVEASKTWPACRDPCRRPRHPQGSHCLLQCQVEEQQRRLARTELK